MHTNNRRAFIRLSSLEFEAMLAHRSGYFARLLMPSASIEIRVSFVTVPAGVM
jgi:hypothetical protein